MGQQPIYGVHIDTDEDGTFEYSYTNVNSTTAKSSRVIDYEIFTPQRFGDVVRPKEARITLSNNDGSISTSFTVNDRVLIESGTSSTEEFYGEITSIEKRDGRIVLNCKDLTNRLYRDTLKYNIFENYNDRKLFDIPASPKKYVDYLPNVVRLDQGAIYSSWSPNDAYAFMTGGSQSSTGLNTQFYDGINMGPSFSSYYNRCVSFKNDFVWMCADWNGGSIFKFYMGDMSSQASYTYAGSDPAWALARKHNENYFISGWTSLLYTKNGASTNRTTDVWTKIWSTTSSIEIHTIEFDPSDTTTIVAGKKCLFLIEPDDPTSSTDLWSQVESIIDEPEKYTFRDIAWGGNTTEGYYAIVVGTDNINYWYPYSLSDHHFYSKRGVILKIEGTTVTKIRDDRKDAVEPSGVIKYTSTTSYWSNVSNVTSFDTEKLIYDSSSIKVTPNANSDYKFKLYWSSYIDISSYNYFNLFVGHSTTENIYFDIYFEDSSGHTTESIKLWAYKYDSGVQFTEYQLWLDDILTPFSTTNGFDDTNVKYLYFQVDSTYNTTTATKFYVHTPNFSNNSGPYYAIEYNARDDFFLIGGSRLLRMDGSTNADISTVSERYYASSIANKDQRYQGPIFDISYKSDYSMALITSPYCTGTTENASGYIPFASMLSFYGDVASSGNLYVDLSSTADNYIVKPIIAVEDPYYYLDNLPPREKWAYYCESDSDGPVLRQYIGHRDWQFHQIYLPLARVGCDDPRQNYKFIVGIGKGRPDSVETLLTYTEVDALKLPEFKDGPQNTPLFKIDIDKRSINATDLSSTDGLFIYVNLQNSNFNEQNHVRLSMTSTFDYFIPENQEVIE